LSRVSDHEQPTCDLPIRADTHQYGLLGDCLGLGLTAGVASRNILAFVLVIKGAQVSDLL
jgi:hypothetical protein